MYRRKFFCDFVVFLLFILMTNIAIEAQVDKGLGKIPPQRNEKILNIDFKNPIYNTSNRNWAKSICSNGIWLKSGSTPRHQWSPILNPRLAAEDRAVAVEGVAVNSHESRDDVWFTHPFGFDFNFDLVWKSNLNYDYLVAPTLKPENEESEEERKSREAILNSGVENPKAIHVETDLDFIPTYFRPKDGDRVAVFGRWIVDCGHDNYQSEIHPPLMLVKASANSDGIGTRSTVISRPFLVSQEFEGKSLVDHLIKQAGEIAGKALIPPFPGLATINDKFTARSTIQTVPFTGVHWLVYYVRPPIKSPPNKRLSVSYHFTVRTGVSVKLYNVGDAEGTVMVTVVLNDATYKPASLPPKKNWNIPLNEIKKYENLAPLIEGAQTGATLLGNPFVAYILQKGVDTDRYQFPTVVDPPNITVFADRLPANTPISINDSQPFPIRGTIEVKWVDKITTIQTTTPTKKINPKVIRPPK